MSNMRIKLFLFSLISCNLLNAQVKLPAIIRDSMVLQRDVKINIWGWAAPSEKVTVTFKGKKYKTFTTDKGKWSLTLDPVSAGGPYSMTIAGKNTITLKEILFGDVWFCSGQSNMVHQLNIHDVTYAHDIATANYATIRQFLVPNVTSMNGPVDTLATGFWKAAVGEDVRPFSAVAYFFARRIHEQNKIPVGIINASWGGTPIEAWMSEEGLADFAEIKKTVQLNKDTAYINSINRRAAGIVPSKSNDKGMQEAVKWFDEKYIPQNWKAIAVPGYWEDQGIKELNGVVWYRKEIHVPASMTGKAARLFLGRITDADVVYINGRRVGNTTYMYPQRRYAIAADVLKAGKNSITVRVTNYNGKGGFVPDKPYYLFTGSDTIDLSGYWQYKVGEVFMPGRLQNFSGVIAAQNQPAALFNAMVSPLTNYNIRGFVWYQGESNVGRSAEYAKLQPAQITDWRKNFNQSELPFLYVQLPNFMDANYLPSESLWAELREAQLKSTSTPNTGMAVTIDLGEWNDIHPDNKKDVGERLALIADKLVYGKEVVYSGPVFHKAEIKDNKMILSFKHIGGGLISKDGEELREFAIAGADKKFVWAKAKIEGDKIIVWHDEINNPLYVRYAWADNPDVNFYNKEGLPASPFRTY